MSRVYRVLGDRQTVSMRSLYCRNEGKELQNLLEANLQLIPGDQINTEEPRRWLLLKRELPVEDPATGENRWSLDFLMLDQDAVLTLVECKRFRDVRAKREVIGQMLDYAANALFYLTREKFGAFIEEQARKAGVDADTLVRDFAVSDAISVDTLFENVKNKIAEGQLRLVFFMEEAPPELKSVVLFLNQQMERAEVLIVEAKQFEHDGDRIVVPSLWGYTDQARRIKKTVTVRAAGERRSWDEQSFRADLERRLDQASAKAILHFYDRLNAAPGIEVRWGSGKGAGSFSAIDPRLAQRSFLSVFSDGRIWISLGWLRWSPTELAFRDAYSAELQRIPAIASHLKDHDRIELSAADWISSAEMLLQAVENARANSLKTIGKDRPQHDGGS
jgi:hypothetical protein